MAGRREVRCPLGDAGPVAYRSSRLVPDRRAADGDRGVACRTEGAGRSASVLSPARPVLAPIPAAPPRPASTTKMRYRDLGGIRLPSAARDIQALTRHTPAAPLTTPLPQLDVRAEIARRAPALESDTDRLLDLVGAGPAFAGLCRYLAETLTGGYASAGLNHDVLRLLLGRHDLTGARVADLACGNGEVLRVLRRLGAAAVGVDSNPLFIQKARRAGLPGVLTRADLPFGMWEAERGLAPGSCDVVLSTLALDRVERPRELLANVFRLLRPGGQFAIQTLLPIVGVDDGPAADPIVYTPPELRITPGTTVDTDRAALLAALAGHRCRRLTTLTLPYAVRSRDGVQHYTLHSFTGHRC